jgi:RNA polymerase subunit RPABC4/transcription elongation factor Spt4
MVMIRCPDCGQSVLDIASSCPKCGRVLIQNPLETHDWASLRACGRCGKHIDRDVPLCPYCGHKVRAARIAQRVAIAAVALAVAAAAGVGLWRSGMLDSVWEAARAGGRPAASPPLTAETAAVPPLLAQDTVPPQATPILAAVPDTAVGDTGAAGAPAPARSVTADPATRTADAAPPVRRGLVTRWTTEWANVRAARSVESAVVQVLPPGRAVEVREMRQGWWALHAGGAVVGYVANSVLTTDPPTL